MIDVGGLVISPEFAQSYTVYRETGSWQAGRWVSKEASLTMTGTVTVAKPNDIMQIPEGERVTGAMCFYSLEPIYETRLGNPSEGTSDQVEWNGSRYRIYSIMPWSDYGYCKAIGVRMVST